MSKLIGFTLLWLWPVIAIAQPVADLQSNYQIEIVTDELEHPWSVAFLPDGSMLVTERPGRLRLIDTSGTMTNPVIGLPPIFVSGQAGLFDVLPAPDFANSQIIYLSYAHGDMDANGLRISHARLDDQLLVEMTPIFTSLPLKSGDAHFGGRMAWMDDGTLVFGTGDGFYFREDAQKLDTHHAKIIRINADGSVPSDNPFVGQAGVRRVPLSAAGEPGAQEVLFTEAGQRFRDVRSGPDGALYLLTDESPGQLLRVVPRNEINAATNIETVTGAPGVDNE